MYTIQKKPHRTVCGSAGEEQEEEEEEEEEERRQREVHTAHSTDTYVQESDYCRMIWRMRQGCQQRCRNRITADRLACHVAAADV